VFLPTEAVIRCIWFSVTLTLGKIKEREYLTVKFKKIQMVADDYLNS
jgi:hypothetical protein